MLDTGILQPAAEVGNILPGVARGLCFDAAGKRLIDNLDLTLEGRGVSVVLGPNGAGKTLLLRLLHGLLKPTAGSVTWRGSPPEESVRRRQALVFQRPVLLRRSVRANLAFVLGLRGHDGRARIAELLDRVGLTGLAERPARQLSGGEQQRLAIARALAHDPDVLFLDEPAASLDPAATAAVEHIVRDVRDRGTKIVLVTHDFGQAKRLADEVVFLHRGRLLEQTPATDFFTRPRTTAAGDFLAGRLVL